MFTLTVNPQSLCITVCFITSKHPHHQLRIQYSSSTWRGNRSGSGSGSARDIGLMRGSGSACTISLAATVAVVEVVVIPELVVAVVVVVPAVVVAAPSVELAATTGCIHDGHRFEPFNQSTIHLPWKLCPHSGMARARSPFETASRHIAHSASSVAPVPFKEPVDARECVRERRQCCPTVYSGATRSSSARLTLAVAVRGVGDECAGPAPYTSSGRSSPPYCTSSSPPAVAGYRYTSCSLLSRQRRRRQKQHAIPCATFVGCN